MAVILSVEAHRQLAERPADDFWSAYERFRQSTDLTRLAIDASVFEGVRDRSPGREPAW